jgi:hypothetical protein
MRAVPSAASAVEKVPAAIERDENQPGIEDGNIAKESKRIVLAVESKTGVRKPPSIPRMATTRALSRAASRNAVVVISTISRKVGIGPKNSKW